MGKKEDEIIKGIKEKKKIPKEIKKKILSEICDCTVSTMISYTYFIFLYLGLKNINQNIYLTDLKVFTVSLAIITVVFFEKAYYGKSTKNMLRGIETLTLAIITLLLQYVILYLPSGYRVLIPLSGILVNIYYVFKAFLWARWISRQYKKDSNDIKTIVRDTLHKKRGENN